MTTEHGGSRAEGPLTEQETETAQHTPVHIVAEETRCEDIRPGELFSARGADYWDGFDTEIVRRRSIGESVFIRTNAPVPPADVGKPIYRIHLPEGQRLHTLVGQLTKAVAELLAIASLRGDNDLPHPADDPKEWSARMQTAWDELAVALAAAEEASQNPEAHGIDPEYEAAQADRS